MIGAVLDANVIISGTIAPLGSSAAILDAWRANFLEIVYCPALLAEIEEKLRLPRIREKYSISEQEVLIIVTLCGIGSIGSRSCYSRADSARSG